MDKRDTHPAFWDFTKSWKTETENINPLTQHTHWLSFLADLKMYVRISLILEKTIQYDQVLGHHYHQDKEDELQIVLLVFLLWSNSEG